jgi:hypothetical protein
MHLQTRFIIPEVHKWRDARETTLGFIARWCQDYLHVQVWNLQWQLAGVVQDPMVLVDPAALSSASEAATVQTGTPADERRYNPRYECEGSAEIRIPARGRLIRGRIVNLSTVMDGAIYCSSLQSLISEPHAGQISFPLPPKPTVGRF